MSKIPPHAVRVFKGVIFDVYQWEQMLYDGSTTTFECLKRPDTVIVIPLAGEMVYYAEQAQPGQPPFLSLFGGRAEAGEDPLTAARRELLEETGLISDNWHALRQHTIPGKIDWTIHIFVARACRPVADQALDAGEKITLRQTTLDDFLTNIVPDPRFSEIELRQEIFSALNPSALNRLRHDILGGVR